MKLLIINLAYVVGATLVLVDVLYFADIEVLASADVSMKYIVKLVLFGFFLLYLIVNVRNVKKIALSIFVFMPVLFFYRELIQVKSHSFTFSLVEFFIIFNSIYIVLYLLASKKVFNEYDKLTFHVLLLLVVGGLVSMLHTSFLSINAFALSYVFPLSYFLLMLQLNLCKEDVISAFANMMFIAFFIFVLQNIYVGPVTVYYSSVNQTWLKDDISIANGGFLEIGAMESALIPIAFYFIYNKNKISYIFNKHKFELLLLISFFIMIMPFVYHNRANSLLTLYLFAFYVVTKYEFKKQVLILIFIFPFLVIALYDLISARSFVDEGLTLSLLGFSFEGLDYTTYNHLFTTMLGFEALKENTFFGIGSFVGAESYSGGLFKIGNFRNFIIPTLEVAIYNGILFYLLYLNVVRSVYLKTDENILKVILMLQFIPIIGANKFFGLYATGTLDLGRGFESLNEYVPISIYSILTVFYLLLFVHRFKGPLLTASKIDKSLMTSVSLSEKL